MINLIEENKNTKPNSYDEISKYLPLTDYQQLQSFEEMIKIDKNKRAQLVRICQSKAYS